MRGFTLARAYPHMRLRQRWFSYTADKIRNIAIIAHVRAFV